MLKQSRLIGIAGAVSLIGLAALWVLSGASVQASQQAAAPAAGKTRGLVVTYFWYANYEGDDDCPDGPAQGIRRLSWKSLSYVPAEERERLLRPGNEHELATVLTAFGMLGKSFGGYDITKYLLGPNLARNVSPEPAQPRRDAGWRVNDQCTYPTEFEDPPLKTAQGKIAYGMNLDGSDGASPAANMCQHKKFTGPNGEAGVDNQMYRVVGCIDGYRHKAAQTSASSVGAGTVEDWTIGARKDGGTTILIEIVGAGDGRNADNVQIAIYPSSQATPYDVQGKNGVPFYSLTAAAPDVSPGYTNVARGRIVDGVLTTEPADLKLPFFAGYNKSAPYLIRGARLRLEIQPDGKAKGLLAGYQDVEQTYFNEVSGHAEDAAAALSVFDGSCPAIYAALHNLADGYPDSKTGKCTAISSAFRIEAVPAFVIHLKENKTAAAELPAQGR